MSDNKTVPLQIRISEDEFNIIKEKADKLGLTVSAYLRFVGLNAVVDINLGLDN